MEKAYPHSITSVGIWSFSGLYFPAFGLSRDTFHAVLFLDGSGKFRWVNETTWELSRPMINCQTYTNRFNLLICFWQLRYFCINAVMPEAIVCRRSSSQVFLRLWKNSLENTCVGVFFTEHLHSSASEKRSFCNASALTLIWVWPSPP